MKKCPNCKVKFKTNRLSCPFCHKILEDIPGDNNYQEYPKYQQEITPKRIPLKICIFLSLIAIFVTILINFLTLNKENPKYWFAIVIGGLIFLWILVGVTIISKNNIAFSWLIASKCSLIDLPPTVIPSKTTCVSLNVKVFPSIPLLL